MTNISRNFIAGRMNKVVDERLVPDGEYIDAMNVRMGSTENSEIGVIENTKGNIALTKLQYIDGVPLSTNAVCIGAFSDTANDTLYWFVHDPTSESHVAPGKVDMIVSYNIATNILTYHVISVDDGSNLYTTLNFNPAYLVTGVNKIGNLLFFTDNYNPPRFINVKRNYPYPSTINIDYDNNPALLREALLVVKKPPTESPSVRLIRQGDENNYLNERFISFAYRYRYIDGEYSATSQWSDIAFSPKDFEFSPNSYLNEGMTNAFNAAVVSFNTGGPLVVGIDLLFKQANNNIIKVIEKLDKAELGIADNAIRTLTFNNSKIFTVLLESEILRLYDNVPRLARAQTLMGNRLMYGNYIEGYDLIDKFGTPTRLEYQTQLVSEDIGFQNITSSIEYAEYLIDGGMITAAQGVFKINLTGFSLTAGSSIVIDINFDSNSWSGVTMPSAFYGEVSANFSFTLGVDYPSVYAMVTSPEFQNAIGTAFNILPVYSPIAGDLTSCDGTTFTDQVNCVIPNTVPSGFGDLIKFQSGVNAVNEPCAIIITDPSSNEFSIQLPAMGYAIDPNSPTQYAFLYPHITSVDAIYQKVSSTRSLHSNRGYEIGIVYMDEFNRSTTALVSPYNTEHIPCGSSINRNSITVGIPVSQRAPAWAKRYKFVCKASAENYETIYSNIFFTEAGTNDVYFLLEGENMRKVEVGDRYIVKRDTNGPLLNCVYATVLEKEAKQSGFITTTTTVTPPAGVYMKILPEGFQATQQANAVISPGQITTNENNGGEYPLQEYPMNIWNGSAWVDYTVPAGSVIQMSFKFQRLGAGDGNNSCERRIYTNDVTLVASANYANMYDWFIGDNVASVLDNGTSEVGGTGNCPISNTFYTGFGTPTGDVCNNKYQFYRYGDNQLVLKITGTQRCPGATGADKRRSSITTKITVFRADTLMVFETLPTDTLPDVFFENNLSFPIDAEGNHLSGGFPGNVSQDIALGIPAVIQTGFFNCFAFGNAVESYKIRDSIIGRSFNFGERVTSVSAQDYKEARRFADMTYSGVYNQETNVNKLNEFNAGLLNFKNLETSFGDIQILDGRETDVLVLQEDKISYVLAGKNLLSDAAAGSAITSVPEVLGTQIARVEKYGISFNPESYVHWGYDRFFTDVKRGAVIQLKGDSMAQDQLGVVSELNMRTWFRDTFIESFDTQKLGGYDPYMNEYVLSTNDRQLPSNPQCVPCGVPQTITLFSLESQQVASSYCLDLKSIVGTVTVTCTVLNIQAGAEYTLNIEYNGTTYTSGSATGDSVVEFIKDSVLETTAQVTILVTGSVTLSIVAGCPLASNLTIREIVLTSDSNSGQTIHAEYRYTDGGYISPLQSNLVVFQSGTDPVVSRYNSVTGIIGSGSFPTDGSIVTIQSNKVVPDTFNFDPLGNKFRYLRTDVDYSNTPGDIATLLSLSSVASPISPVLTSYHANFNMPVSSFGDYLYLIWDLRDSGISNLCYSATGDESSLRDLCCLCSNCTEACVNLRITNNSPSTDADIYFPYGMCGSSTPVTITVLVEEVANVCVNNEIYYVTSGDVSIEVQDCGCVACFETCQQYTVWTRASQTATISYNDCTTGNVIVRTLGAKEVIQACVTIGQTINVTSGSANIDLSNACGCCLGTSCITWELTHNGSGYDTIQWVDCNGDNQVYNLNFQETIQICTDSANVPTASAKTAMKVVDSCNCLSPNAPCQIVYQVGVSVVSQLTNVSPVANKFPIIYQATGWGTNGGANYYGRFFNIGYANNDVNGFNTGSVYHIEITLSSAFSRDIGIWFGRTAATLGTYAPDATMPAGVTSFVVDLPWNPHNQSGSTASNGVIGWIGKLGSNLTTGWNGTITVNVYKGSCPTV